MVPCSMVASKFILHYNFPGFSTGEVKPNRGPGRREVGHGNLRVCVHLKQVLPNRHEEEPYTIRIVSDILGIKWFVIDGNCLCWFISA
jgi:polyribonucleotide nucleotidyltransferase